MRFIIRLILSAGVYAGALWVAQNYITNFSIDHTIVAYSMLGIVLALAYTLVRPILKIVFFPIVFLTAGLFTIVINGAILWSLDFFFKEITIEGLVPLFTATIVISLIHAVAFPVIAFVFSPKKS